MNAVSFRQDERIQTLLHEAERLAGTSIRLAHNADSGSFGEYSPRAHTIRVGHSLPEDVRLFAIAHELAHAIWWERRYPRIDSAAWLEQAPLRMSIYWHGFLKLIKHINNLVQDIYADDVAHRQGFLTESVHEFVCQPPSDACQLPDWQFDGPRFQKGLEEMSQAAREEHMRMVSGASRLDLLLVWRAPQYAAIAIRCACRAAFTSSENTIINHLPGIHELGTQLAAIAQTYPVEEPERADVTLQAIAAHLHMPQSVLADSGINHEGGR